MEISDLTKSLLEGHQIIIVEFSDGKCLTFLVADEELPSVPGYPACALSRFKSYKEAQAAIIDCYKKLNYQPKNKGYEKVWKEKRRRDR